MKTYEEYEKSINEVLSNPDTALANIKPVLDSIKEDISSFEEMTEENKSLQDRIRDLQDTNMKLFLAQVGEPGNGNGDDEKEPATGNDVIEEFLSEVFNEKED